MVFSSLTFLFLFLPILLLTYYASPGRAKNAVLFFGSLLFYAWGEPVYVVLMVFSTLLDYTCGRLVERYRGTSKQKFGLILSLCGNLGLLFFFKYADFLADALHMVTGLNVPKHGLPLPIGISFYTFQTMSYTIDVYRGKAKMQQNILSFGTYVALFPQLIAGPIVRYRDIAEEIDHRTHSFDRFGEGARRFVTGLAKKVLLANNIGLLWETVLHTEIAQLTMVSAWLGIVAFGFQIYFDFSGYSDMAIGLGSMLGFTFPENFNYPFISKSVTEFWQRWHISLGAWFRDYVYIPLGGNRRGLAIQLRNIAVVWLLTGFWHGAGWNYILWGAWFCFFLIAEKLFLLRLLSRLPKVCGHIYTQCVLMISWPLFANEDVGRCFSHLRVMFGGGVRVIDDAACYQFLTYAPLLIVCAIGCTSLMKKAGEKIVAFLQAPKKQPVLALCDLVRLVGLSALSLAYLIGGSYNPFLYFRF